MSFIDSLLKLVQGSKSESTDQVPEGICPNCWGRGEYAGQFYDAIKNEQVNAFDVSKKIGWIQDYANKHLSRITIQPDKNVVCQKCKVSYNKS